MKIIEWAERAVGRVKAWLYFRRIQKCLRVGHDKVTERRDVLREQYQSDLSRGVAYSVVEERDSCRRCRVRLSGKREFSKTLLQQLTAPASIMDELRARGVVVVRDWYERR